MATQRPSSGLLRPGARIRRRRLHVGLALMVAAGAMALTGSAALVGCGQVGCFRWSSQEGPCPERHEALEFFGDSFCSGVRSVDGDPDFDGTLCCYPITRSVDTFCAQDF